MRPSADADHAVRALADLGIVRDEEDRVARPVELVEEREDLAARARVEVPVGSSARSSEGRFTSARAIATRWRSPPESWFGGAPRGREPDELEELHRRVAALGGAHPA
jgi:hypothetical protein